MADGAQAQGIGEVVDPGGILRGALEKSVLFESRVSRLESELGAARSTALWPQADAEPETVKQRVLEPVRKVAALAVEAVGA